MSAQRSITPDEQPAVSGHAVSGPPAWFVAIKNLETKLDDHAERDERHHEETKSEIKSLKSRNGIFAALGGGAGYGIVEALKAMFGG